MVVDKLDLIGNTPMVKLEYIVAADWANVYAKLESRNFTGSMKARSALRIIEGAEKRGDISPGHTLIDSTSGNFGLALAAIGAIKGYRVILVVDPKTDVLKRNMLEAYGAKIVTVTYPDERGAYQPVRIAKVKELLGKIPNSWQPDQYNNPDSFAAHYETTGPEIFDDMNGNLDVLIGSVGTCAHLGGAGKYLKEKIPELRIVGVEPDGSILSGGEYSPYLMQGPGISFIPGNYDPEIIQEIIKVSDTDAFYAAIELSQKEQLLCGASAGSVMYVAKELAQQLSPHKDIVVILPDDGFRYGLNFYDGEWLKSHGIKPIQNGDPNEL